MEEKKDTLDVMIEVEEYPPYYFQFFGGYESSKKSYAGITAGNKNLFGRNKELSISLEASGIKLAVTAGLNDPSLFHSYLSGNISSYWQKEKYLNSNFETEIIGGGAGLNYKWESRLQSIAQIQLEKRDLFCTIQSQW